MKAMIFAQTKQPLKLEELAEPDLAPGQLLLEVSTCGVCRTDLHIIDNELKHPKLPLVPGHEIIGRVKKIGAGVTGFKKDDRVGVPWLGETCGTCKFCKTDRENLCDNAVFTGYTRNGGYATETVANANFCFPIPDGISDEHAAPLLCAGLIGWRTLKLAGPGKRLGIYGFGAAAHITIQIALSQGREVYGFTRAGDEKGQAFAKKLGATWAGSSEEKPPELLDAALIFAPVGALIPLALAASDKGATIVSGGIHMSDIPSFPYSTLWEERTIKSVANLTRKDAEEFFELLKTVKVETTTEAYELKDANIALDNLRSGKLKGAADLNCSL
jgi:propanol-preferring alcohol dehydrogenase